MSDSAAVFAVYVGIGVLVAAAIFAAAFWLANAAKKGNIRFARRQRSLRDDERAPARANGPARSSADEQKGLSPDE